MDTSSQSKPLTQEKRTNSWKQAVVYDPAKQTLYTKAERKLKGTKEISKIALPKFGSRVDIYVDEDGSQKAKGFVATVNLDRLGWAANMKRHLGSISHLYVMELPDETRSPLVFAA
ncbi:hypothetical protein MMC24_003079 [Lignoscripta atroalba]|nr:hypothetical protein [Lignoscripta atroalba]